MSFGGGERTKMKKVWVYLEENLEEILMVILLAAFSLVMFVQVIARNLFHGGFTWAEEVCRYLFVYSGMLSAGYCIRKGLSIRVDAVYNFFPKPVKFIIDLFAKVLTVVVYAYLTYKSIGLIQSTTSISAAMQLPIKYVYAAIPLGMGLGTIRGVQDIFRFCKKTFGKGEEQ
ncbi:MAG: TRAP transporter small permease [Ruminococcaceae bacterium]|nr:TRAP transporter small permease [Oscillospiraceae bacterium]